MRKYMIFAFCLTLAAATSVNCSADPLFQTQTAASQPTKQVNLQEFFKSFIDLRQKANNEVWLVTCLPKGKDPYEVKYSGTEQNKAVEAAVLKLQPGDSIVISTDTKPSKHIITYVLKPQTTKK
jgi:hypothetical protein